jgi:hypothetical protein
LIYQWSVGGYFGHAVSAAGDVDNDGHSDVIVGGSGNLIFVYSGATGATIFGIANSTAGFGLSVSGAGDVNNDGFDDVIVGAHQAGNYSGSAFVYSGATASLISQWSGTTGSNFGWSVSGAGDVNNDGFDDVIVGAYTSAYIGSPAGSAYVYSGINSSPMALDDNVVTTYNSPVTINVLSNDSDPDGDALSVVAVGTPSNGWASIVNDQVAYTPSSGWAGTDSFIYFIEDTAGNTASATVTVEVTRPVYTITNFIAGAYANFLISDATPNSQVLIGYSLTGPGPTNTPFGPVDMTLPIKTLVALPVDINGEVVFSPLVPASAFGLTFYTQAKCGNMLSNSLALTVQ